MSKPDQFSRRERQIMDVLYRMHEASAKEVMENIPDAPSYSSVRTLLGKLVGKGHIARKGQGLKYVYYPLVAPQQASQSALKRVVKTFFEDSPYLAVNRLLDMSIDELSDEELDQLNAMIQKKRKTK